MQIECADLSIANERRIIMNMRRHKRPPDQGDQQHGIQKDSRGQDQPVDKSRAQQVCLAEESPGKQAQRDAANTHPFSLGAPAGGE
jgi:hypothetical protein